MLFPIYLLLVSEATKTKQKQNKTDWILLSALSADNGLGLVTFDGIATALLPKWLN